MKKRRWHFCTAYCLNTDGGSVRFFNAWFPRCSLYYLQHEFIERVVSVAQMSKVDSFWHANKDFSWPIQNTNCDAVDYLEAMVWEDRRKELGVRKNISESINPALVAKLFCIGVYERKGGAFLIFMSLTLTPPLKTAGYQLFFWCLLRQKGKQVWCSLQWPSSIFHSQVASTSEMLDSELWVFSKSRTALASKWDRPFSKVMHWTRCRLLQMFVSGQENKFEIATSWF